MSASPLHHRILTAAEADDVTVRILDVEILRSPLCRRQRLQDRDAVGDALVEKGLNTIDAGCRVEVLMITTVSTVVLILRRFLQVQLEPVEMADGVEAIPRFAEREAELLVVGDRAMEVIDKKLGSEGGDPRCLRSRSHGCLLHPWMLQVMVG